MVRVPLGVHKKSTGGTEVKKTTQMKLFWKNFLFEVTQRGYKSDLGVHRGVQFGFEGM